MARRVDLDRTLEPVRVPAEVLHEICQHAVEADDDQLLQVHEALSRLEKEDEQSAELIKLRFFVGLTNAQAARVLNISERTAKRNWSYARAWLYRCITQELAKS